MRKQKTLYFINSKAEGEKKDVTHVGLQTEGQKEQKGSNIR